jgi:hypothetical protein
MKNKTKLLIFLGLFLFGLGVLIGLICNAIAVWTDLEGMSFWGYPEVLTYDPTLSIDGKISSIKCPVLITPLDNAELKIKIKNPETTPIEQYLQYRLSNPSSEENMERFDQNVTLESKQIQIVTVNATVENVINRRNVLFRAYLHQSVYYPPSFTVHCGIFFVPAYNFEGWQVITLILSISIILMSLGILIWHKNRIKKLNFSNRPLYLLITIFVLIQINYAFNLLSWIIPAAILLILSLLLILSIFEDALMRIIRVNDEKIVN